MSFNQINHTNMTEAGRVPQDYLWMLNFGQFSNYYRPTCTLNVWRGKAGVPNLVSADLRSSRDSFLPLPSAPPPPAQMNALMGTLLLGEAQKTLFWLINFFQLKFSGKFPLLFPVGFPEAYETVSLLAQSPNFHLLPSPKSLLGGQASHTWK